MVRSNEERKVGIRNVITLGIVSFLNDMSTEMIRPMLPTFVINVLGGTTANWGLIEGISEFLSYALRIPSGIISDIFRKRKALAALGYGISTICKPFLAFSTKWIHVLLLKSADRVGKGIRTAPRDAMIAESVKSERAGIAFGIHRTLDQAGAIMGPLLAFMLFPLLGYRKLFLLSFIPGILAVLILLAFAIEVAPRGRLSKKEIRAIVKERKLLLYTIITLIFMCALYSFSYVLIYANKVLNIPDRYLNIVFIVLNITHVLVSMPIGAFADRIGIDKGLSLTCALFVLASLYMMKSPIGGILGALIAGMLYGLFQGGYETLSRAAIPVITKEKAKGSAYAMLSLAMALGSAIGNIVIGFLWQNYGYVVALLYSAIIAIVCAILMPLTVRK